MPKKLLAAGIYLSLLVGFGKLLAFGKEVVISYHFGISNQTDAYFVASNITTLLITAFYATISLVFLPLYNAKVHSKGLLEAHRFASNVLNLYVIVTLFISFFGIYFAPELVDIIAPGLNVETANIAIDITRILSLAFVFSVSVGVLSTMQYVNRQYLGPHLIPVVNNSIIILAILFAYEYGVYAAAFAAILGWILQVPIQILALKNKYKYSFYLSLSDESLRKMGKYFLPVFVGVSVDQINILVDTILASGLNAGSVSSLTYANRLLSFASGIFVMVVATLMYPVFSDYAVKKQYYILSISIQKTIRLLVLMTTPVLAIALIFSSELTEIVFRRGAFGNKEVESTAAIFLFYSLGIVFIGLREILNRVYYSLQDVKTPLLISIISVFINIALSLHFIKVMGASGLALATSISTTVFVILQVYFLKEKIGTRFYKNGSIFVLKIGLAVLGMLLSYLFYCQLFRFDSAFIKVVSGTIFILTIYVLLLNQLKVREIVAIRRNLWLRF